ncbi:MAG: NAD(P)/FAD-dependent oxidoreductase [Bacteroidia bacterium]
MENEHQQANKAEHQALNAQRKTQYDCIIVGQGLAGTLLAYSLEKAGKSVLTIDKITGNASRVAPGMFNPVTGRRLSLSWKADEFLQTADSIYTSLEKYLGAAFYYPMPILRIFGSEDDYTLNEEKAKNGENSNYVKHFSRDAYMAGIRDMGAGVCEIAQGGYLDTQIFLDGWRNKLQADNTLLEEDFDYDLLKINETAIEYKDISAQKIIFCEGFQAIYNPYFNWLPFNPAKGDVLTISAPGLQEKFIINKNVYIVPVGNSLFRVGATYKWQTEDFSPSEEDRKELETSLKNLVDVPYKIIDHLAGIRPATKQRRPFLGMHPEFKNIGIFNGLGTKGVLLAPLLAEQMVNHILFGEALDKKVDISAYDYSELKK